MIKEIWTLAKMLFGSKPSEVEKATLMGMDHFPFEGYKYFLWCGKMIYRNDMYETRRKEWITKQYKVDKNHETIHLKQAQQCGSWVKYYLKYLWEWLKGNPFIAPGRSAYYTIPFEAEAYANEEDMTYCDSYDGSQLKKYDLDDRKKRFKQAGGTSRDWKEYVKTL